MKVFVYSKKNSKKIATLTSIIKIEEAHDKRIITCSTKNGETFSFDTTEVKTTIYQN